MTIIPALEETIHAASFACFPVSAPANFEYGVRVAASASFPYAVRMARTCKAVRALPAYPGTRGGRLEAREAGVIMALSAAKLGVGLMCDKG